MILKTVLDKLNSLVESNPELLDYTVEVEAEDLSEELQGITHNKDLMQIRFVGSEICYYHTEQILFTEGTE